MDTSSPETSPTTVETTPDLEWLSVDAMEDLRKQQAELLVMAGQIGLSSLSLLEIMEGKGTAVKDQARVEAMPEVAEMGYDFVKNQLGVDEDSAVFAQVFDLVDRYSMEHVNQADWNAGRIDADGKYPDVANAPRKSFMQELNELKAELGTETTDANPELSTETAELLGSFTAARENYANVLAERSKRSFSKKFGRKQLESASEEYERARDELLAQLKSEWTDDGVDEAEQTKNVIYLLHLEAAAMTDQIGNELKSKADTPFGKFYTWWGSTGQIKKGLASAGITAVPGAAAGLLGAALLGPIAGAAAGGLLATKVARKVVTSKISKEADAITHADERTHRYRTELHRQLDDGEDAETSNYLNEANKAEVHRNRRRLAVSVAIGSLAGFAAAEIGDHWFGHGNHAHSIEEQAHPSVQGPTDGASGGVDSIPTSGGSSPTDPSDLPTSSPSAPEPEFIPDVGGSGDELTENIPDSVSALDADQWTTINPDGSLDYQIQPNDGAWHISEHFLGPQASNADIAAVSSRLLEVLKNGNHDGVLMNNPNGVLDWIRLSDTPVHLNPEEIEYILGVVKEGLAEE